MRRSTVLTIFFGIAFIALVGFMQFDPDDFVRLDALGTTAAHPFQTLSWVEFFLAVTTLGSVTGVVLIALLTAWYLRSERSLIVRLMVLIIGESLSVQVVKSLIARVRPDALPFIGSLHSFSFPSGHATSAMALFGFIGVISAVRLQKPLLRWIGMGSIALLILAVGVSRIILAAHYASDVLAGFILGAFWLSLVFALPLERRGVH